MYFAQLSSGLVLEIEIWRHFDTKQKSKSFNEFNPCSLNSDNLMIVAVAVKAVKAAAAAATLT